MLTNPTLGQRVAFERTGGLRPVYGTVVGIHRAYNTGQPGVTWQEDIEGIHCCHNTTVLRPVEPGEQTTRPRHKLIYVGGGEH